MHREGAREYYRELLLQIDTFAAWSMLPLLIVAIYGCRLLDTGLYTILLSSVIKYALAETETEPASLGFIS